MPKMLITGGTGFIGSNLIANLIKCGTYDIVVVDKKPFEPSQKALAEKIHFLHGDICNKVLLRSAMSEIDIVVHLAADTRVIDSIKNPKQNFDVNVIGSFNLLQLSQEFGVSRFINASTGGAILGEAFPPVHEKMPANPLSPYGASKLAVEGYCSAFAGSYGMKTVSLRFSNVYGIGSFHKGSVIAHFYKLILDGTPLTVYGDGSQTRDYIYVGDIVDGIKKAACYEGAGVLQLGTGIPTSLNDLLGLISKTVEPIKMPHVNFEPKRAGEIHTTYGDITLAKNKLGFNPQTSLSEGLALTWDWFQNNYDTN